ncbi:MAG: urea carboxylase-associated family protein [Pseudolabrys sp.]|jgi:hypothetical protein
MTLPERKLLQEITIQPGTGKALELRRGQILRIAQTTGRQCADFNCFNLHDYKEFFHTGRTRHLHGMHPTKGDFLWSAPPRERPMMAIIEDTVGTNDVLYPRCSAFLFEHQYGLAVHTNCHDIQAEAQREYGLTPDDVHDSFNFFMHTGVSPDGHPYIAKNAAKAGDYVELLALFDVLAIPNVCGADVMMTSDFELKPLKLSVFEASDADWAKVNEPPRLKNQRNPEMFRIKNIKADRPLCRDGSYEPEFTNVPIEISEVEIELGDVEAEWLSQLAATGKYGETDAEVLRYVFHAWWIDKFMRGPKHVPKG